MESDDEIRWPRPLTPDEARALLAHRGGRRLRSVVQDADISTSDASVATFTLRLVTEFRARKASRRRCDTCAGRRKQPCASCGGTADPSCAACGGAGRVACDVCDGQGQLVSAESAVTSRGTDTRVATWGELPRGTRRARSAAVTCTGDRVPDGLPDEVVPVVAPLIRGSDREVGRRLHVDITPVTKVEIWKGDALRTAWIVGTDEQVVDTRSRTVRRRALAGVGIAAVAALGVAVTTGVLPAFGPSQDDTAVAPTPAPRVSASESAGSSEPVVEPSDVTPVSAGPSQALQLWRDLGVLDGGDAGSSSRTDRPG